MIGRISSALSAAFLVAGLLGSAPSSAAAVITPTRLDDPPPDGCAANGCSLREAVIQANETAGPDEIVLAAGTYRLTITGPAENLGVSGDLDITHDGLTITGTGKAATVIDAGEEEGLAERVFHIEHDGSGDPPDVAMSELTITGGWANTSGNLNGGGIWLVDGELSLTDLGLIDNYGGENGSGGALQAENGTTATLTRVEVADNSTTTAGSAAGIALILSTATIVDSAIHDNHAMYDGGGIASYSSTLSLRDSTVSGNTSTDHGGGLHLSGGTASLDNVTITRNVADSDETANDDGGGVFRAAGTLTLRNTIVAGNEDRTPSGNQHDDCSGTIVSEGHNLIGNDEGCTIIPGPGDQIGSESSPIDPKLGPLADNGGPTLTHALLLGSPAIDGGEPAPARAGGTGCDAADQRGAPRSGTCDIGAYELVLCKGVTVNRVGTEGDDVLTGTSGIDGFLAQGGNDRASGLGGSDAACMGAGKDTAAGGGGKDKLLGEAGKDRLKGQGGKDVLRGGPGKDTCVGGGGRDKAACEKEKKVP